MAVFGGNLKKQIFNLLAAQGFGILLPASMAVDPAKLEKPHPPTHISSTEYVQSQIRKDQIHC